MIAAHQIDVSLDDGQPQSGVQPLGVRATGRPGRSARRCALRLRRDADAGVLAPPPPAGRSPAPRSGRWRRGAGCTRWRCAAGWSHLAQLVGVGRRRAPARCRGRASVRPRASASGRTSAAHCSASSAASTARGRSRSTPASSRASASSRSTSLRHLLAAEPAVLQHFAVLLGRCAACAGPSRWSSAARPAACRSSCEMSAVACFSRAKARLSISSVSERRRTIGCSSPGIRRWSTGRRKSFSETRLTASDSAPQRRQAETHQTRSNPERPRRTSGRP